MFGVQLLYRLLWALFGILCSVLLFFLQNNLVGCLGDVFPSCFPSAVARDLLSRNEVLAWASMAADVAWHSWRIPTLFACTKDTSKAIAGLAGIFEKHAKFFLIVLMLGVSSLYGYLAYPPNFLISNAALHWWIIPYM